MAVTLHKWCLAQCVRPAPPCKRTSMPWCALRRQAPLRMEMKGVCNEFLSARVPDPVAISQLRGENHRDGGERVERWGSEMKARRGSRENTGLSFFFPPSFFFPFFYTPALSAWLPGCYNVKLAFLSVYREQCGTVTWRQEQRGRGWRGRGEGRKRCRTERGRGKWAEQKQILREPRFK